MPMVLSSNYGILLPSLFALGTSLPLIIVLIIIWMLGVDGSLLNKSKELGTAIQKTAGIFLILIGILDTITYWS
jgi:cytochrome c-type biogenesis protein